MPTPFAPFDGGAFDSDGFDTGEPIVSSDLTIDYEIVGIVSVQADLTLDWFVHAGELVSLDLTLDNLMYGQIQSDLVLDNQIVASVGFDLVLDFQIAPVAATSLTIDYLIASESVSTDLTLNYPILLSVGTNLVIDWTRDPSSIVGTSLTLNWKVETDREIIILVDGVDITRDLIYPQCEFTSLTNGSVGNASILLRDAALNFTFRIGAPIELFIGSDHVWSGYLMQVSREYPFEYEDLSDVSRLPRYLRLRGVDINVLFERRVTVNESTPTNVLGPGFNSDNTPDIDAIRVLCDSWLDLSGDNIDTVSGVEHVGEINVDQPANPFSAGWRWKDAMAAIAMLPAAVFYLTPDRKLIYTDVDTITNPMVLTDRPDEVENGVGFRSGRLTMFGDKLTNDYLAWGVRQTPIVFSREEDAASIALHGRWQDGNVNQSIYKQATVNRVSDSFVYGSPSSKRGHKDDRNSFMCTTFQSGFKVAQKVRVISEVHDFEDVLPIRQMRVTFPVPGSPKFQLVLSHEIDAPWNLWDIIRYDDARDYDIDIPPPPPPPPDPPQPACLVLDSFSRFTNYTWHPDGLIPASTGGWGTGEHLEWSTSGISLFVGGAGIMHVKEPEWPDHRSFGGGSLIAQAMIPNDVNANDIVFSFSFDRLDRLYPTGGTVASVTGTHHDGTPLGWSNPGGASEYEPSLPAGYGLQPSLESASIGATVVNSPVTASLSVQSLYGPVTKTIIVSGSPSDGESRGPGGKWHSNNAGFIPGIWCWGSSSWTAYSYNPTFTYSQNSAGNLAYFGGYGINEILHAGPDSGAFIFNQPIANSIQVGAFTINIGKGLGPFGLASDAGSGQAFGVTMTGPGGYSQDFAKVIEPGFPYFMRVWNPDGANSYSKVWGKHENEPEEWQGFKGDKPPWALDVGSGEIVDWPFGKPGDSTLSGQMIRVVANIQPMHQHAFIIDSIYACGGYVTPDEDIPILYPPMPSGAVNTEVLTSISGTAGQHTVAPYVPGSLMLWVNGTVQRKNIDFAEANPSTGTFVLNFTADPGDKVTVRYIIA